MDFKYRFDLKDTMAIRDSISIFVFALMAATVGLGNKPASTNLSPGWLAEKAGIPNGQVMLLCVSYRLAAVKDMAPTRVAVLKDDRLLIGFGADRLNRMHEGDVNYLRSSLVLCTRMLLGGIAEAPELSDASVADKEMRKIFQIRAGQTEDDPEFILDGATIKPVAKR